MKEFESQLTPKLIDKLRNYARPRAFAVAAAGRKVDGYYTRELVQDAIGDTWAGRRRWDPQRCSLEVHLAGAIRSRADKHRKHAEQNPHDALGDDTDTSRVAEEAASTGRAAHAAEHVYSREALGRVRAAAAKDRLILRIVDAYAAGAQSKADVLAMTSMRASTYHNAHIRLKRIVRNLTDTALAPKARA